jgi:oligopeptide transport system permease protein
MMTIPRSEFAPAPDALVITDVLDRPRPRSLSLGFTANLAAALVVLLMAFVILGPVLWKQDPSRQWLSQISSGPVGAVSAKLVGDHGEWRPQQSVPQIAALAAHTEYVRLQWPGAGRSVAVYRNLASESGLGMPLAQTDDSYYEDVLQLRPVKYRYTLVDVENNTPLYSLDVLPEPAISVFEASLQGLVAERPGGTLANYVRLPAHPLGTDALGRDMLARLIAGGRTSLFVGIVAPLIFISFGCLYGAVAAMLGGWFDQVAMRFVDFVVALPFLLFMILLRVAFGIGPGEDGVVPLILAMVIMSWTGSARLIRGQVLSLRQQSYVEAARLAGLGNLQIIWRHVLPNVMPIILVCFSFAVPQAIFTEAFLSFIGMGVAPPSTSWGALCNDGMKTLLSHPEQMLLPAAFISITVLAFNILGDALRDVSDHRLGDRR